jgi:transcriptional regulator with XRE-family HTH domain
MVDTREIGQRIARARRRRGLSQAVLAGLVDRSESWLSQVERGKRGVDSHTVLTRLTEILHTDIGELTGPDDSPVTKRAYSGAAQIEQAMMCYDAISESITRRSCTQKPDPKNLLARIGSAYHSYQATRYEETGRLLPGLIREVEEASRMSGLSDPAVCEARALAYDTATALLSRVGEHMLAWTAADRAIAAAEQSGRPILTAFGSYRLAYVLANRQHPRQAVQLAVTAADALEQTMKSPSRDQLQPRFFRKPCDRPENWGS